MINESNSDLIIILTPSGLHYEHANYALNKNFNVLVEKPISLRYSDSLKLTKRQKKRN